MSSDDSDSGIDYLPSDTPFPLPMSAKDDVKGEGDGGIPMEQEGGSIPQGDPAAAADGQDEDDGDEVEEKYHEDEGLFVPLPAREGGGGIGLGGMGKALDDRETFVCEVCDNVILSSRDTMRSHYYGKRHNDAVEAMLEMLRAGELEEELVIRQVKNPASLRKKVPVRLQVKLLETDQPVVGLECVDEFMPLYDSEMEPYYMCNLCGNIGEANGLFNHVTQSKHQMKFFHAKFPEEPRYLEMNKEQLRKCAQRFDEVPQLRRRNCQLIRTYESDLLFPWPQGKAPWAVEQGGDGQVPTFARENVSGSKELHHPQWRQLKENRERALLAIRCALPDPATIPKIVDDKMCEEYCMFAADLAKKLSEAAAGGMVKDTEVLKRIQENANAVQAHMLSVGFLNFDLEKTSSSGGEKKRARM